MGLVQVISFDCDGALFNSNFYKSRDVIEANKDLLDQIVTRSKQYKKTILFAGTNRQSISDDSMNASIKGSGSAYPALLQLERHLNESLSSVELDRFLLTDLYHKHNAGKTFKVALTLLKENSLDYNLDKLKNLVTPDWLHDESKLTVLYAQIHRIAKRNINHHIDFYFYDDREDILKDLKDYFEQNPDKLPKNLCLYLSRYKGDTPQDTVKIQGTGCVDKKYKETVRSIASQTIQSEGFQQKYPVDSKGQPIRSYEHAKQNNFVLTEIMNCLRDNHWVKHSIPAPTPPKVWQASQKPTIPPGHFLLRQSTPPPIPTITMEPDTDNTSCQTSNTTNGESLSANSLMFWTPDKTSSSNHEGLKEKAEIELRNLGV